MKAVKNNKEYNINEAQKKMYLEAGYDIKDDDGNVIDYGRGKTIPFEEYQKACDEIKRLKERVEELEAAETQEEVTEKEAPEKEESEKKAASKKAGG